MAISSWWVLKVNPEPWAIGPLSVGRKNGKIFPMIGPNPQLKAFQEAVREEIKRGFMLYKDVGIEFFLWRRLEESTGPSGRKRRANYADATNMQKALEDALQGLLIDNDRQVRQISTTVVEQSATVNPCIVIHIYSWGSLDRSSLPADIAIQVYNIQGMKLGLDIAGFSVSRGWEDEGNTKAPWSSPTADPLADIQAAMKSHFNQGQNESQLPVLPLFIKEEQSPVVDPEDYF